ncbi:MAG: D-glycero-beta-D-manno-heptose-7-phosphate kinase [Rhizobiales bacterium]|nr:D-glycero-beta-D-manno-heptose-7-phosphate kinase [Hyphomicrobiales bacterium]
MTENKRSASDMQPLVADLGRLSKARVLCLGDVMLDRFIYGHVERISPEAPIPVLRVDDERAMLGGVGNVARNLAALGAHVSFASLVGDDEAGHSVAAMLGGIPGLDAGLVVEAARATTVKTRYVSMGQQILRADQETTKALSDDSRRALMAHVDSMLFDVDVMVVSDYGKGVLAPALVRSAIEAGLKHKVPVIVDPKGRDYALYRGAAVVTPNRKELGEASGLPVGSDDEVVAAAQKLMADCGIAAVVVTRSQDGMSVIEKGSVTHLKAEAREVFDVSGAGDTVVSALASALATGFDLGDAARIANSAAGIVVGKVGTAVVHLDELEAKLHEHDLSHIERKIVTRSVAQDIVANWQAKGLKVGFTNGCFDLLHPGHIALISAARARCDRLVMGLNSDASVKRLKGETRPVQSEQARATVLAALAHVDLVVLFEEDTPEALIKALAPDLLVKGGDYTLDQIVGADFVMAHGGRVEIIDLVPGFSTTSTVARMK